MAFFKRLFGKADAPSAPPPSKPNGSGGSTVSTSIENLDNAIELLEKREQVLNHKIEAETNKAKEFMNKKNKAAALQCLKRKKLFDEQVIKIQAQKDNLETMRFAIQDSAMNREVLEAQRRAGRHLETLNKGMNAEQVEDDMDKIREAMDQAKDVSTALTQPIDGEIVDEDDLEKDLMELMGPQTVAPVKNTNEFANMPNIPSQPLPEKKPVVVEEEDEDAALRALEAELNA